MSFNRWLIVCISIISCVAIEIGPFLKKLDHNLTTKLDNPGEYNSTQLFKDLAAYSFNIKRLLRLFKLRRGHVMEAAKSLHAQGQPSFLQNFSVDSVKEIFSLPDKEYAEIIRLVDMINVTVKNFAQAATENPEFISIPLERPNFALERLASDLEFMFKNPESKFTKYKMLKSVEEFHYLLGKFTKKFVLGRKAVMNRARAMFESGGLQFLKQYDYFKIQKAYLLSVTESASLDSYIRRVQKRYVQFTHACYSNPNFESKIDFSSVKIVEECENRLKSALQFPSPGVADQLFKHLKDYYHVLGYLRRYSIPNRAELLRALFEYFGTEVPQILDPQRLEKMKKDFGLDENTGKRLQDYIGHLGRRFVQVQKYYLDLYGNTTSRPFPRYAEGA